MQVQTESTVNTIATNYIKFECSENMNCFPHFLAPLVSHKLNHLPTCVKSNLRLHTTFMLSVFDVGFKMLNAVIYYCNILFMVF